MVTVAFSCSTTSSCTRMNEAAVKVILSHITTASGTTSPIITTATRVETGATASFTFSLAIHRGTKTIASAIFIAFRITSHHPPDVPGISQTILFGNPQEAGNLVL